MWKEFKRNGYQPSDKEILATSIEALQTQEKELRDANPIAYTNYTETELYEIAVTDNQDQQLRLQVEQLALIYKNSNLSFAMFSDSDKRKMATLREKEQELRSNVNILYAFLINIDVVPKNNS